MVSLLQKCFSTFSRSASIIIIQIIFEIQIPYYTLMSKKKFLIFPILILAVVFSHVFVTAGLTVFSEDLNWHLFQRKHISSHNDKIWLVETLGVWFAIYLFGIATLVMLMRIVSGKSSPASQTDPVYINTLNRIITNTIEQTVIFAGLYGPILFSGRDSMSRIGGAKTLAIASIFVVGRVLFGIGYVLGSITGISPLRSFGFATAVVLNVVLISYHLGFDSFQFLDQHVAPILQPFFS